MTLLSDHSNDYFACQELVAVRVKKDLKDHPVKFGHLMAKALVESQSYAEFLATLDNKVTLPMRKAHDFYGWMAKNESRGVCKGAIYRSKQYMQIPMHKRSGAKRDRQKDFSVHIEHTIPINQIIKTLWSLRGTLRELSSGSSLPALMHEQFLSLSVCTALTGAEEKQCIKAGLESSHQGLSAKYPLTFSELMEIKPFERYDFSAGLVIYNVVSGSEIDPLSWTISDHLRAIKSVDTYNWEYLTSAQFS